jgi:hypothetical protein
MSFQVEVIADASGKWATNSLRFATTEEAEAAAVDLARRWVLVREWRITESAAQANYRWDFENHRAESIT